MKRLLDVTAAGALLLLLSPVMLVAAIAIRVSSGRPVLFRQRRPGLHGRMFELVKFRTMREAYAKDGSSLPDAERLTGIGKLLRTTSVDELPQLWNVLRGDMSLVGPRPLLPEYLSLYSPEQARRHEVRPGITGWAQVNGRNAVAWEDRFRLDVWYVDNRSMLLDLKILAMTARRVVARQGVSQPGNVTMEKFRGSGR